MVLLPTAPSSWAVQVAMCCASASVWRGAFQARRNIGCQQSPWMPAERSASASARPSTGCGAVSMYVSLTHGRGPRQVLQRRRGAATAEDSSSALQKVAEVRAHHTSDSHNTTNLTAQGVRTVPGEDSGLLGVRTAQSSLRLEQDRPRTALPAYAL